MTLFVIIAIVHVGFFLFLSRTWDRIEEYRPATAERLRMSILVPVRNEAENIVALLHDLSRQSYDPKFFEVIVIDDHSEDDTSALVDEYLQTNDLPLKLLKLDVTQGKKAALTVGVEAAKGEIMLCTDGDCRVPRHWIATFASYFAQYNPLLVSGPVKMESRGVFGHYQALDFSSLIGFGAATLQKGIASTCNGANLAYKKTVFEEVQGYAGNQQLPSGDDEFLLQKVFAKYPGRVHFIKSRDILVSTQPKEHLDAFLAQRVRWSSKWRFHANGIIRLAVIYTYLDYVSIFLLIWMAWMGMIALLPAALIIAFRWLSEGIYLHRTARFLELSARKVHYPLLSFMYPFYIFFLGFASIFGHYSWKGRKY